MTQPLAEPEVRPAQSPGGSRAVEQNPDIRFLGRILGNIIRQYGGETLFRRIEYIRSTSVDRYRGVIHRSDLDSAHPYNTYRHAGLPPGPIANPGIASIRAALAPAESDSLYFVARPDGSGAHEFSNNIAAHESAAARYHRALHK